MNDDQCTEIDEGPPTHPIGLPYVRSMKLSAETRKVLAQVFETGSGRPALLWAGVVGKVGRKVVSQKRLLVVSAVAIHQYSLDAVLNRNVNIAEVDKCFISGSWLGIRCPTQYDLLFNFADENECKSVVGILKVLASYLSDHELQDVTLQPNEKIKNHLRLAKPTDWASQRVAKIRIPTKAKVQTSHDAAVLAKNKKPEETVQSPTMQAQGTQTDIETESRDSMSASRMPPMQDDERRQMEEDVESLTLAASEWERKANVLRVREAQLEAQLKTMKAEAEISSRKIEDLTLRNDTLSRTCDQQNLEVEHLQKERRAACKELSIDPDGDVSLTEAARRIEARHSGLTDRNWELTKQIAILEKQLKSVTENPKAHLEADAEALQQLINIRSSDLHAVDRQRSDAKAIQALTKQLHKTKQQHEETKLKLFEVEENYASLEHRFKEHTATTKVTMKNLEKKLKEARSLAPGVLLEESIEKPRFSTSTPAPNSATVHNSNTREVDVGGHVVISRSEGMKPLSGVVRYSGKLKGVSGPWVGVELDDPSPAACEGTVNGVSYFKTGEHRALFVRPSSVATRPPPSTRMARSRSPSLAPSMPPPPPSYGAPDKDSDTYLELALAYKEELQSMKNKLRVAESQASVMNTPMQTPSPMRGTARGRSVSPATDLPAPPAYPKLLKRERSRDRSPSPNMPVVNPQEAALREAVSSCVAQLGNTLPRSDPRVTTGDLSWASKRTMLDNL